MFLDQTVSFSAHTARDDCSTSRPRAKSLIFLPFASRSPWAQPDQPGVWAPLDTVWTAHSSECSMLATMRAIQLRISHLAKVTGYSRFQIRGLLNEVFRNPVLGRKAGAQRTFSPQELLVVVVCCEIEQAFGISRRKLGLVGEALRRTLTGPRAANREARLLVTLMLPAATYLDDDAFVREGIVVHLGALFARVDEYLGVSGSARVSAQGVLPLRPAIATARRSSGTRSR